MLELDEMASIYMNPLADRRGTERREDDNKRSMMQMESEHIKSLLAQFNGHRSKVADVLKISERTLYRKLKQYGLQDVGKKRGNGDGRAQADEAPQHLHSTH
jgi:DNA-binding NtrC family response regulator